MKQSAVLVFGVLCACPSAESVRSEAAVAQHGQQQRPASFALAAPNNNRKRPRTSPVSIPLLSTTTSTSLYAAGDGAWSYGASSDFLWGGSLTQSTPSRIKPPPKSTPKKRRRPREKKDTDTAAVRERPYSSAIEALRAYHSIHGNLVIPRHFVVPKTDDYPAEWHGVDLASAVYDMRWWQKHVKNNSDRVQELNSIGFVWERLQPEYNLVLSALMTYSSLNNGSVMVHSKFVVPFGDDVWPQATWGLPLGKCVHRIRVRGDYLNGQNAMARRRQLDGLGFVWDVHELAFVRVYRALKHFRKLERAKLAGTAREYRILRVPSKFVVPSGDESGWPEDLWGLQLGARCAAIRLKDLYVKNNPERRRALEDLGFQFSGNATLGWLEVIHAAAIYSRLHGRNLDVPARFVVPAPPHVSGNGNDSGDVTSVYPGETEWPWPEHLWGLTLGQRLKDIRLRGAYLKGDSASSRRAQLDALGFNWSPKRGRGKRRTGP